MAPSWEIQELGELLQRHLKALLSARPSGTDDSSSSINQSVLPSHQFIVRQTEEMNGAS